MLLNPCHILVIKETVSLIDRTKEEIQKFLNDNTRETNLVSDPQRKLLLTGLQLIENRISENKTQLENMSVSENEKTDIRTTYNYQLKAIQELRECFLKIRKEEH